MGKARKVLRQVLDEYEMSLYSLAAALNIERNSVYRWVNEKSDSSGETILDLVRALKTLQPEVAKAFANRYLGEEISDLQAVSGRFQVYKSRKRSNVETRSPIEPSSDKLNELML
mgnify:CR=1 FL=1